MKKNDRKSSKVNAKSSVTGHFVASAKPYSPHSYKVVTKSDVKIYNPRVVSTRKNIISA